MNFNTVLCCLYFVNEYTFMCIICLYYLFIEWGDEGHKERENPKQAGAQTQEL